VTARILRSKIELILFLRCADPHKGWAPADAGAFFTESSL
jgi:hypothetical protein